MNYSQTASEVIECMAYISRETLQVFPRGIAGGEMGVLINLSGSESERTPGELSRIMNVSTGRVASALKSLEKKKYIERVQDRADKRRVTVRLTAEGREYAFNKHSSAVTEVVKILGYLGESDAAEAARLLRKVTDKMRTEHSHKETELK